MLAKTEFRVWTFEPYQRVIDSRGLGKRWHLTIGRRFGMRKRTELNPNWVS